MRRWRCRAIAKWSGGELVARCVARVVCLCVPVRAGETPSAPLRTTDEPRLLCSAVKYVTPRTKIRAFRSVFAPQKNTAKIRQKYVPRRMATVFPMPKRTRAQRDHRRGTSDEVVCVLAQALGFARERGRLRPC